MKKALVAIALILLCSFSIAEDITDPKLVKQLDTTYKDSGKIMVINGDWYGLELNLTIPQSRVYQQVSVDGKIVQDEDGNTFISLYSSNPPNPFEYSISTDVKTFERKTSWLPEEYNVSSAMLTYLASTEKAQADNTEIQQLAEEITKSANTDFEHIALLAIWVSENIEYDLNYVNKNKDAVAVMNEKKGVCLEHSNLYTALARSLGYPTRYLLGKAYGSYGWLGHSWNEVYLGRWVPVDPTWLEVGHLDATHIEFYRSPSERLSNEVRANASASATIEWPTEYSFFGKSDEELGIQVNDFELNEDSDLYSLYVGSSELGHGDKTVVYAEIPSEEYKVIRLTLVTCSADPDIITVSNPQQYAILEPGKTAIVSWEVTSHTNLKKDVIYTCPLTLNSDELEEGTAAIKVKEDHDSPSIELSIGKPLVSLGDEQSITAFVDGDASLANLITDGIILEEEIIDSKAVFTFETDRLGDNPVIVFTDNGGAEQTSFFVKEKSSLSITRIDAPENVVINQSFLVNVTIENKQEPENVKLTGSFNSKQWSKTIFLEDTKTATFKFNASIPGKQLLRIVLSGGSQDEVFMPIEVHEPAVVTLESVRFIPDNGKLYTDISFQTSSSVTNLTARIGNKPLSGGKLEISPGMHTLTVEWQDVAGKSYSLEETINIPETNRNKPEEVMESPLEIWLLLLLLLVFFVLLGLAIALIVHKHVMPHFHEPKKRKKRRKTKTR